MALSKIATAITLLVILGNCRLLLCWNRGVNARFFDGSLLVQPNSAMQRDIVKSFRTLGAIQCVHACLSESNCVAQTFCGDHGNSGSGMCFLHKNGIREEETNVLARDDKCTYQQYVNFHVSILGTVISESENVGVMLVHSRRQKERKALLFNSCIHNVLRVIVGLRAMCH